MKVSVVVPYFNNSSEFEKCITSIITQSVKPHEIIIVDDNSSDSSQLKEILHRVENKNIIKYFRNEKNENASFSRNFGIKISEGDFIALIDADDFWEYNHIEQSVSKLLQANATFVYSNITYLKDGKLIKGKVSDFKRIDNPCDIILLSPPQTSSFIFRREMAEFVQFDESLRRHQDYQFLVDIVLSGVEMVYNDVYTSVYVVPGHNLSRKLDFDSIFSFWQRYGKLFTPRLLKRYLLRMLCLNMRTVNKHGIDYYLQHYTVLNVIRATSFFKLYKIIGDINPLSKKILFFYFKIKYDFLER